MDAARETDREHPYLAFGAEQVLHREERAWLAATIAGVAGYVDVIAYLVLLQVFIAQQNGNSVRLGMYVARGEWTLALRYGFPVGLFVLSVCLGSLLAESLRRRNLRSTVSVLLLFEVAFLIALLLLGLRIPRAGAASLPGWNYYLLVALATGAMGLQTAALQSVGGQTVRTTYVTGMLTNFAVATAHMVINLHDRIRHGVHRKAPLGWHVRLLAAIWAMYAIGAGAGVLIFARIGLRGLIVPLVVLSVAALADWKTH